MPVGPAAAEETATDWPRIAPAVRLALGPALDLAVNRVAKASCALVLEDFQDGRTRRPLSETLATTGHHLGEHFREVYFADGSRQPRCADPETLATTPVGSPVVFVCPAQFIRILRKDWGFAATALIHELLHTLGLGEDPPTSVEISFQIQARCGR